MLSLFPHCLRNVKSPVVYFLSQLMERTYQCHRGGWQSSPTSGTIWAAGGGPAALAQACRSARATPGRRFLGQSMPGWRRREPGCSATSSAAMCPSANLNRQIKGAINLIVVNRHPDTDNTTSWCTGGRGSRLSWQQCRCTCGCCYSLSRAGTKQTQQLNIAPRVTSRAGSTVKVSSARPTTCRISKSVTWLARLINQSISGLVSVVLRHSGS